MQKSFVCVCTFTVVLLLLLMFLSLSIHPLLSFMIHLGGGLCGESNLRFSFFKYYLAVIKFCFTVILRGATSLANLSGVIISELLSYVVIGQ